PSVGLMIVGQNGTSTTSRQTDDADGKFALYGVAPGPVVIVGSYSTPSGQCRAQMALDVGTDDINNLELRPIPRMDIPGQVRIEGGGELKPSNLAIGIRGRFGYSASATPNPDGSVTFRNAEPDSYRVEADRLRGDAYLKSVTWNTTDV